MSNDQTHVTAKVDNLYNVADLPEPARRAFLLARSVLAFGRVVENTQKDRRGEVSPSAHERLNSAIEKLRTELQVVRRLAQEEGVSFDPGNVADWSPFATRSRADQLVRVGLMILQQREANMEWHPERISLSLHLNDDVLNVGGAYKVTFV